MNTIDPDVPVILVAALLLLILAPAAILFLLWLMKPVLRSIAQFERELAEPTPEVEAKRKHSGGGLWKWLLGGGALVSLLLVIAALFAVRVNQVEVANASLSGGGPQAMTYRAAPQDRPMPVVDITEMSEPKIDLTEEAQAEDTTEVATKPKAETEAATEAAVEPQPKWLMKQLQPNQAILTSDPFQGSNESRQDVDAKTLAWTRAWLQDQYGVVLGDLESYGIGNREILERLHRAEHLEYRDTSVGKMVVQHRLVELNEHDQHWLAEVTRKIDGRQRSMKIALVGSGVLALLATTYVALGQGSKPT